MNKLYRWLFTKEEREPVGFIATFFMIIIMSVAINLLLIPIIVKLMEI